MNCRTAHKRPSTLRPSHLTWAVSPPVGSYRLQPPSPFIIITQPERWYSFTVPRRVEGWVDLGTAGRVHTARAQGCKSQWFYDKHNCPQRDSIPGPRALHAVRHVTARPLRPALGSDIFETHVLQAVGHSSAECRCKFEGQNISLSLSLYFFRPSWCIFWEWNFNLFSFRSHSIATYKWKKALGETQTLRAGRSNAEPKIFTPPQTPFPRAQDGQNLIS